MTFPKILGFRLFLYIITLIVEYNMRFMHKPHKKEPPITGRLKEV